MELLENKIIKSIIESKKLEKTDILILEQCIKKELVKKIINNNNFEIDFIGEKIIISKEKLDEKDVNMHVRGTFAKSVDNTTRIIKYYYTNSESEITLNLIVHELLHAYIYCIDTNMSCEEEEKLVLQLTAALVFEIQKVEW